MKHISLSSDQYSFKAEDSRTDQPFLVTHEIQYLLHGDFEVREVFLDISKAFDKV